MNGSVPDITMPPLLANEPDGRRARFQLFGSAMPVYLALMAGVLAATATVKTGDGAHVGLVDTRRRLLLGTVGRRPYEAPSSAHAPTVERQ